jgi:hypothetical protein
MLNKLYVIALVALSAGVLLAAGPVKKRQSPGFLPVPQTQKGRIAIVNKQQKLPAGDVAEIAAFIAKATRCRCEVGAAEGADVVVEIIDDKGAPILAAYPEDFKATLNVAKLDAGLNGAAVEKFFVKRCRKELLRAFCFACGTAGTQYPDNILAIGKISDLDLIGEFIPGDTIYAIQARLKKIGVTPLQYVSYARACKEGWAPAPTNDVQRIVFEKIKALKEKGPANPIKILPPKKK